MKQDPCESAAECVDFAALKAKLARFAKDRDWERFHSPKNLAMAMTVEASELLEHFQWLSEQEALAIKDDAAKILAIAEEIADIILYLTRLADVLGISISQALEHKQQRNAIKYPIP